MNTAVEDLITEIAVAASDMSITHQIPVAMAVSLLYVLVYSSGHCTYQTSGTHNTWFAANVVSSEEQLMLNLRPT